MRVNFQGTIFGNSGYDHHSRNLANAIYKIHKNIRLDTPKVEQWQRYCSDTEMEMLTKEYDRNAVNIMIAQPQFWRLSKAEGFKKFIGFLVWEGTKIPSYWLEYLDDADLVFVPSKHVLKAIKNSGYTNLDKIKIIPHGVNLEIFKPTKVERSEKFTFIVNKGWRGGMQDRGGVQFALKAFVDEFKEHEANLIVKLNPAYLGPGFDLTKELEKIGITKRNDIFFNTDMIATENLLQIYCKGDVFVSATMGEAFNLPALEAMACQLPTIQTLFGGQLDYANSINSLFISFKLVKPGDMLYEEAEWAEPIISDLRAKMRWAYNNPSRMKEMGQKALETAKDFTWDNSAKKLMGEVNKIW